MLFASAGDAIAVLMPMTLPDESSNGPPELPGLIAASVWMTSCSVLFSVEIVRCSAETIPDVTVGVPSSASALPIATTESPTSTVFGVTELHDRQVRQNDLHDGEVVLRVDADDGRRRGARVGERHLDRERVGGDVRVGDDDAVAGDDEPGTGALTVGTGDVDAHDRGLHLAQDRLDVAVVHDDRRGPHRPAAEEADE